MRTGRAGQGLDFVDFEYPKVRSPAMKTKQRIVIRRKMPGQSLPCDRVVEHPAHPDTVEIGRLDAEADDPTGVNIHHHQDPITPEQNRLSAEEIDTPPPVFRWRNGGQPRRAITARR